MIRKHILSCHVQVPIQIRSHLNIRVTHILLNIFERITVIQQHACAAVPELMEAYVRQTMFFQDQIKVSVYKSGRKGLSIVWRASSQA